MIRTVLYSYNEFSQWLNLNRKPVMALDTETTDLNYLLLECVGFSLATDDAACYVFDRNANWSQYFKLLDGIKLVMHNAPFDLKVLYKYGFEPKEVFCTLTGAKLVDENRTKNQGYGLKDLASDWLGVKVTRYEEVCTNNTTQKFFDYAIDDAVNTWNLYKLEIERLKEDDLMYLVETIEMPFQFVLRNMEINGVRINLNTLERFYHDCQIAIRNLESDLLAIFGKKHSIESDL